MFRKTPNGCTRRNMARFGREGPQIRGNRGDPDRHLRIVDTMTHDIKLEEIERILSTFTQKENKS
jgi:hypothetical protein